MIDYKKALKLAGQVALKSRDVLKANVQNLSWRVAELELVLDEYDEYIFSLPETKIKVGLVAELTKQQTNRAYFSDIPIGTKFIILEEYNDLPTYDLLGYFLYTPPQELSNDSYHYTGYIEKGSWKLLGTIEEFIKNK